MLDSSAATNVCIWPTRHFVALQEFSRLLSEADINSGR
jgi:hypothetical protein